MEFFREVDEVRIFAGNNAVGPFSAILIQHPSLDATPIAVEMGENLSWNGRGVDSNWDVKKWGGRPNATYWSAAKQALVHS